MVGGNRRRNLLCRSLRAISGRINPVLPLERKHVYTGPDNRVVNCHNCSDIDIHILWLQRFQKGFAINTNILFDNCSCFGCGILYLQFINTSIQLDFQNTID
jgi:hypothetical protein